MFETHSKSSSIILSGIFNANNYFLYWDVSTDPPLFRYFRQDLDVAFGTSLNVQTQIPAFPALMQFGDVLSWGTKPPAPGSHFLSRMLKPPAFIALYKNYMSILIKQYLYTNGSSAFLDSAKTMQSSILSVVEMDYWHSLDMGYTLLNFKENLETASIIRRVISTNGKLVSLDWVAELADWTFNRTTSALAQIVPN